METEKPVLLEEEHLEYLDGLRESGAINMFGLAHICEMNSLTYPKEILVRFLLIG